MRRHTRRLKRKCFLRDFVFFWWGVQISPLCIADSYSQFGTSSVASQQVGRYATFPTQTWSCQLRHCNSRNICVNLEWCIDGKKSQMLLKKEDIERIVVQRRGIQSNRWCIVDIFKEMDHFNLFNSSEHICKFLCLCYWWNFILKLSKHYFDTAL